MPGHDCRVGLVMCVMEQDPSCPGTDQGPCRCKAREPGSDSEYEREQGSSLPRFPAGVPDPHQRPDWWQQPSARDGGLALR